MQKLVDGKPVSNAGQAVDAPAFAEVLGTSPLHLLHRLLQVSVDIYNEEVGEASVTQRQFAVLKALNKADGISQSQLCKAAGIDRSTLAELVSRMVRKGLIRRERSRTDARVNLIRLDVRGRAVLQSLLPHVQAANERILGLMKQPEYADLVRFLRYADCEDVPSRGGAPVAAQRKAVRGTQKLEDLPMPPLSKGAVPDGPEADEAAQTRKWKPPKPIWNI
jgi:DNA-binding MarR family transcriptional regulator